jgi:threonine aldolase
METAGPRLRFEFASDTVSGICRESWAAMAEANGAAYVGSYGSDPFSARAEELIEKLFGRPCSVFFIASGTAANAFALSLLAAPYDAIVCHPFAHVEQDESNAPEFFTSGAKLLRARGENGKIDPDSLPAIFERGHGFHAPKVRAFTLTQATELGTVYSASELTAFSPLKKRYPHVKMYMDGARFGNAVAALGTPPRELVRDVDILTLGGSKLGGGPCEAIVCFDEELRADPNHRESVLRRMKRAGHVIAKMRYLSSSWIGLLENDVWLRNSRTANERARELGEGFALLGYELALPVETNQVFVKLDDHAAATLQRKGWQFYYFDTAGAYRFVCSWCTGREAVLELLDGLKR